MRLRKVIVTRAATAASRKVMRAQPYPFRDIAFTARHRIGFAPFSPEVVKPLHQFPGDAHRLRILALRLDKC